MDIAAVRLHAAATASAPALVLRPWTAADTGALVEVCRDDALRRWTSIRVDDEASAVRWIRAQRPREAGERFAFAVVELQVTGSEGRLVGHAAVRNITPGSRSAEVGYWTAAPARGRGVAPRALRALTDWAFCAFAPHGLTSLDLLHQVDNTASCRVAQKSGYAPVGILPAAPPACPLDGHLHRRTRNA